MRKWLTFVVTVAVTAAGLASSGANSAVGQAPKPDLIGKPGDLIRFAGSPRVCAVGEATPRGMKRVEVWPNKKVTTFACWTTMSKGTPVPNGEVIFIWQWANQRKSLTGYTFWNPSATKILPPKEGQVFYEGSNRPPWPAKYAQSPWAVTEDQRLGRKAKLYVIGRWDALRVPTLKGLGFNASIVCDYYSVEGRGNAGCTSVDYLAPPPERGYTFTMGYPWRPGDFRIWQHEPACSCEAKRVAP